MTPEERLHAMLAEQAEREAADPEKKRLNDLRRAQCDVGNLAEVQARRRLAAQGGEQMDKRNIRRAARKYARALEARNVARAELRAEVIAAAAAGTTEVEIAELAGVSRPTVRAWLGK